MDEYEGEQHELEGHHEEIENHYTEENGEHFDRDGKPVPLFDIRLRAPGPYRPRMPT